MMRRLSSVSLVAVLVVAAGCAKKPAATQAAGSGSAVAVGSGSGSAVVAVPEAGSSSGNNDAPVVEAGSGSAVTTADAIAAPIPKSKLEAIIDREAQKSAQTAATALANNNAADFVGLIAPAGYSHAGTKLTAAEVKAALATTPAHTWAGFDCMLPDPKACKFEVELDGITMTVTGSAPDAAQTPVLTFDLTADGTWLLTGDRRGK